MGRVTGYWADEGEDRAAKGGASLGALAVYFYSGFTN